MKHTPGPWTLTGLEGSAECIRATTRTNHVEDTVIAMAYYEERDLRITDQEQYGNEVRANARLIASAPELLQTLQECITEPNAHCLCQDSREALFRRIEAINQIARAAIAKAIGE